MKVAQQVAALAHVVASQRGLFFLQVFGQALQRGGGHGLGTADQPHFNHPAGLESFTGLGLRGLHHVPAPARADGDDAACRQLHQRLAHQGAAAVEQHGQRLFAQACARLQLLRQDGFNDAVGDVGGVHGVRAGVDTFFAKTVPGA